MTHELKIYPEYYEPLAAGNKPFEVRKNDRNYQVGDKLVLVECNGRCSGRYVTADVSYILDNPKYVAQGYVILGLRNIRDGFDCAIMTM